MAQRAVEEGAEIVLTNTPVSIRMGTIDELAKACNAPVIAADATSVKDLENLIDQTMEHFGGKFDFILHSIGSLPNVRKGRHLRRPRLRLPRQNARHFGHLVPQSHSGRTQKRCDQRLGLDRRTDLHRSAAYALRL